MKKISMMSAMHIALIMLMSTGVLLADNCCRSICDLFNCGNWGYQTRVGVYPTIWRDRPNIFLNNCNEAQPVGTDLGELPKFSKFFKLPWIIGTQLHYEWCDCVVLYGELNYIQAARKKNAHNTELAANSAFALALDPYRAISAYVGLMYNFGDWCCLCDNLSFFVGAKIGVIYRENILARQFALPPTQAPECACPSPFKRDFFRHGAKISGGANIGLDYCLCERWSLVFTGEVVVSGGPKGNACIPLTSTEINQLEGSSLFVNKIKTEISFPITLGLRYRF